MLLSRLAVHVQHPFSPPTKLQTKLLALSDKSIIATKRHENVICRNYSHLPTHFLLSFTVYNFCLESGNDMRPK
jgi:hypothetical protein